MEKVDVLGTRFYGPSSREELIDFAFSRKGILIAINAEKIINSDVQIKQIISDNIGYPDGIGAVMALKKKGVNHAFKIPGCELWLDLIREFERDKKFYFIGGTKDVIKDTVNKLREEFKLINIVGHHHGFLNEELLISIEDDIIKKRPDVIFVAMGSPKQEFIMNRLFSSHRALYQGLGGSFDVYTNRVKRAPKIWVDFKLEWAYRLLREPLRINRQLKLIPFLYKLYF